MARHGVVTLRESGAAKVRLPAGGGEAILINTGGGLAGGDQFQFSIAADEVTNITVTGQAAERVYRSLGEEARVDVKLSAGRDAVLCWLPQETILFDGANLARTITADLAPGARLLAAEAVVLGRTESGEVLRHVTLRDRWRIRQGGRLIHAEDVFLDGSPPSSAATLGSARAFATVLLVAEDAARHLNDVRRHLGANAAASAWNGKLVARLAARDGFELRKSLISALSMLAGGGLLPRVWSL